LKKLYLANWWERFFAWLIDVVIVGVVTSAAFWNPAAWPFSMGISSVISFLYWTGFEGYNGQSIGKMIFNIRMTGEKGEKIDYTRSAIQSFGKAFLLPIDVIVGLVARPENKVRAFNILSHTVVIKLSSKPPEGVKYIKKRRKK